MERQKYEVDAIKSDSGKYKLEGVVTDQDGNPLANVDLSIKSGEDDEEYTATTDSDGKFLVEDVSSGKYSVSVQSDLYAGSLDYDVGNVSDDSTDEDNDGAGEGSSGEPDEGEASSEDSDETEADDAGDDNKDADGEKDNDDDNDDGNETDSSEK